MSLITDALKRAQEQRTADRSDDRARRLLTRPAAVPVARGPARVDRPRLAAASALVAAVAVLLGVVVAAVPDVPAAPPAAPAAPVATESVREPGEGAEAEMAAVTEPERETAGATVTASAREPARESPTSPRSPTSPTSREAVAEAATRTPAPVGAPAAAGFRLSVETGADARTLAARALAAQQRGDAAAAIDLYRQAIGVRPSDPQLHNNLGMLLRGENRPEEAAESFLAAVTADPGYAVAWSNLGMVLDGEGRSEEAVAAFRSALRADPTNLGARVNLANTYLALGVADEARRLLTEALRTDPTLAEAQYAMGRALETAGDTAGAVRHYRLFLNLARGRFPAIEARVGEHLLALERGR
jgi:Tfp pilus assembly protein PilF